MAKSNTKSNIIAVVVTILLMALLIGGILAFKIIRKPAPIPDGAIGNTSGNIVNHGLFCEADGYVYFSNSYDQRKLYKMKLDGTELKCIGDVPSEYINVYDKRVFFYQTPGADDQVFGLGGLYGVCSTDTAGKSGMNNIDKTIVNSLMLFGPMLYYQHYDKKEGLTLYSADPDTEEKTMISDARVPLCGTHNGRIVSYDEASGCLLSYFDPVRGRFEAIDGVTRGYNAIVDGNNLYFMNLDDDYKIYRMSLSDKSVTKVVDCTVDTFNVYNGSIFYQRNSTTEPALMRTSTSGEGETILAEGNYTNINCTSTYTYFYSFGDNSTIYRVPTNGGSSVDIFRP